MRVLRMHWHWFQQNNRFYCRYHYISDSSRIIRIKIGLFTHLTTSHNARYINDATGTPKQTAVRILCIIKANQHTLLADYPISKVKNSRFSNGLKPEVIPSRSNASNPIMPVHPLFAIRTHGNLLIYIAKMFKYGIKCNA